jgi:hypothetical protein
VEDDFSTGSAREVIRVDPRRAAGDRQRQRGGWWSSWDEASMGVVGNGLGLDLKKQCS